MDTSKKPKKRGEYNTKKRQYKKKADQVELEIIKRSIVKPDKVGKFNVEKEIERSGLNYRQIRFCYEYAKTGNGLQSYKKVYECSDSTAQASSVRLLSNVLIKQEIQRYQQEILSASRLTSEMLIKNAINVMERCMQAEPVKEYDPDSGMMIETGEYKFAGETALKAMEFLRKHKFISSEFESDKTTIVSNGQIILQMQEASNRYNNYKSNMKNAAETE